MDAAGGGEGDDDGREGRRERAADPAALSSFLGLEPASRRRPT
jgi:hypothetical protein